MERPTAIVTGASSGFGRLTTLALANVGYDVFAAYRGSRRPFEEIAAELAGAVEGRSGHVNSVQLDVADDASVEAGVRHILKDTDGRVDVLVNAAGFGTFGPFEAIDVGQWRRQYETNVFGVVRMSRAIVPTMRRLRAGLIVNFGSDVGVRANFWQSAYASSKFAVEGLSQALRLELQQFGIRVCLVSPGWYDTPFGQSGISVWDRPEADAYGTLRERWEAGVNAVEGPNPEERAQDVADLVVRLASTEHPAFRNAIGWNPDRPHNVIGDEFDQYEDRLFDYYGIRSFRRPSDH
jgi:NAD(P)-dependent dehydrogenase (short-subunit alcohol dehydrogenase family)